VTSHTFTDGGSEAGSARHISEVPEPRAAGHENATLTLDVSYPTRDTAVLRATGEVDSNTVDRLRELLHCRLRSQLRTLELNLSRVSFLSIGGAQMLARATAFAQYWQTELIVVTTGSRAVRRVLHASGLDRQLPVAHA